MFVKPPVTQRPSPNFDQGRSNSAIIGICYHIAQGQREGVANWFANPASQVSAHFLICRDGSILQFVDEADTAWAQGILSQPTWPLLAQYPEPNRVLIGIEHEGTFDQPWTEPEYAADLALSLYLCETYKIKPERPYLLGHIDLDMVSRAHCPGPNFPWVRLLHDLQVNLAPLPAWLPPVLAAAAVAGISDGSRPMQAATRAEALTMVMRAVDARLPAPLSSPTLPADAPAWLLPYLPRALTYQISDGSRLGDPAQRVEVMAWAVRALGSVPDTLLGAVAAGAQAGNHGPWDPAQVAAAARAAGISDGSRPTDPCTRGEAIALALRVWEKLSP